jgi:hypothetical protein
VEVHYKRDSNDLNNGDLFFSFDQALPLPLHHSQKSGHALDLEIFCAMGMGSQEQVVVIHSFDSSL